MRRSVALTGFPSIAAYSLSQTIANAVVIFMVQCFFIRRIWVLSGYKHWLAVLFSGFALTTLGGAMFFGINDAGHSRYSRFHGVYKVSLFLRAKTYIAAKEHTPVLIMWSVADMVLDGLIAGLLCYYLHLVRHLLPPSSGYFLTLKCISPGAASRDQTTLLTRSLSSPSTLVFSLSPRQRSILFSSSHHPLQLYTLPSTTCSLNYTQTLFMGP